MLSGMALVVASGGLFPLPLRAQPAVPALGPAAPPMPPAPPRPKPPTDLLRQLLAAAPAEREALLASRPERSREIISQALREFDALSAGAREVRLQTLEMGWHLDQLLRLPQADRAARLDETPERLRPQLEERLTFWDRLPEILRREILESRSASRVIFAVRELPTSAAPSEGGALPPGPPLPPAPSEVQRQRVHAGLRVLFDLSDKEKGKIIDRVALSEAQRAEVQKTMASLQSLTPDQRDLWLEGLSRYAALTPEQRAQFLKNCQTWKSMSAVEQAAWRHLVASRLRPPPPLPGTAGKPPLPPGASRVPPRPPAVATN
jgi:hypothetical protein